MPSPQRKFGYSGNEMPSEEHDVEIGDQWIDTNESPPVEKVCTSLDPVTFTILAQEYTLPDDVLQSQPPTGYYIVKNIAVNPATGKMWIQYDDTPAP